ncbi:MAG: deoxyhypusine synthase [Acidobacteria bacterium]|nr:deoxyhypusine synthase [Acidobacteriota bacterium]
MAARTKADFLKHEIEHIDIKRHDVSGMVEAMRKMAYSSRDLARAAEIIERAVKDPDCTVFLTLAGSLISAGLKGVILDLIDHDMVDAIVSTGANIVDQDFFEALGFKHYIGTKWVDDQELRELHIDRIYDTFIDEDQLKECDMTVGEIARALPPRPYSSREFIAEMGRWLVNNGKTTPSITRRCYEKGIPIFCPAFSDSSAGFGLVHHQWFGDGPKLSIDSVKDFLEVTRVKLEAASNSAIFMIGGGVPKNFIQDTVVCCEVLGFDVPMHKYAVQVTVADERDGALSGSTLKEACSWGKVDTSFEQMVYAEATVALPLIAGYLYHRRAWQGRREKRCSDLLATAPAQVRS